MMQLSTHLVFPGTCEAAFRFYERVLGARIGLMQTYGESPGAEQVAPQWRAKIVHASITVNGRELACADVQAEEYEKPQGFFLLLAVAGVENSQRVFAALAEKGVVKMPIQKTFWSEAFGVVVDQFGMPWEISGT